MAGYACQPIINPREAKYSILELPLTCYPLLGATDQLYQYI
jgi:hypothetical protein